MLYIDTFRELKHRSSVRYLMRRLYMQWILCKSKTENNIAEQPLQNVFYPRSPYTYTP